MVVLDGIGVEAEAALVAEFGGGGAHDFEEFLGGVVKSLSQRRALVEDTGFARSAALIRGSVPIAEMFGYLTVLRSQTQGRGSFSLEPLDYRPLPRNLVDEDHERLFG